MMRLSATNAANAATRIPMRPARDTGGDDAGRPNPAGVLVAVDLQEALDRGLPVLERLGQPLGVLRRQGEEVVQAALRVVRQRVDPSDVLLGAGDPQRRPAVGQRARAAHRCDDEPALGRDQGDRQQPVRGKLDVELHRTLDGDVAPGDVRERLAPDLEHRVGAHQRVAHRPRLLGVQALGLVAVLRLGEVEVARDAQQLGRAHGLAGAVVAGRDVGLDRAEVAPAVEDHRDLLADRQAANAEGDGGRCLGVDQGPPKQVVGAMIGFVSVAHACSSDGCGYMMTLFPAVLHRPPVEDHRCRLDIVKLLYKPVGIVLGLIAGFISRKLFDRVWALIDREEPPKATTRDTTWPKVLAAAAVEGLTFKVTRAAVDRAGARGFAAVTGAWPGEKRPEPEDSR